MMLLLFIDVICSGALVSFPFHGHLLEQRAGTVLLVKPGSHLLVIQIRSSHAWILHVNILVFLAQGHKYLLSAEVEGLLLLIDH